MFKTKVIVLCLVSLSFLGCSNLVSVGNNETVLIKFPEPNRIQFQGKGAGAGIALMSTMGPVGIALGVAIDEGIAKDIREAASISGFDMPSYISNSIDEHSQAGWKAVFVNQANASNISSLKSEFPNIVVKRYGFKTTGAVNDATSAELVVFVNMSKEDKLEYHYPNDFIPVDGEKKTSNIPSYPLAELKINGALSVSLMQQAIDNVVMKLIEAQLNPPVH
jgi:hypothetical protein